MLPTGYSRDVCYLPPGRLAKIDKSQVPDMPMLQYMTQDKKICHSTHSEAVLWRNSPPNKYYDYYFSVNGHEWVEWGVQVNLWNMGVFLQLVWKRRIDRS